MRRVSVCIPAYNGAKYLPATLESVCRQRHDDLEIIVVDDASPDNTREVVESWPDPRVRYVRNEKNLGVPGNLERALNLATGEYVGIYEDQDLFHPDLFARSVTIMERDRDVGFVATGVRIINFESNTVAVYTRPWAEVLDGAWVARQLLTRPYAAFGVSNLIRRSALVQIQRPWFDARYWWYADIHLWLRLASRNRVGYIRDPLISMRMRPPGHFLSDKHWQSLRIVNTIHRDDWRLGYPAGGISSKVGWVGYAIRRDFSALWTLAMEQSRDTRANMDGGIAALEEVATLPGRFLSRLICRLPLHSIREPGRRIWEHLARARRRRQQRRAFGQSVE